VRNLPGQRIFLAFVILAVVLAVGYGIYVVGSPGGTTFAEVRRPASFRPPEHFPDH